MADASANAMLDRIKGKGKERYTLYLPSDLIKKIRQAALDTDKTQSKVVAEAVSMYLAFDRVRFDQAIFALKRHVAGEGDFSLEERMACIRKFTSEIEGIMKFAGLDLPPGSLLS